MPMGLHTQRLLSKCLGDLPRALFLPAAGVAGIHRPCWGTGTVGWQFPMLPTFLCCPSERAENSSTVMAIALTLRQRPQTPGLASQIQGEKAFLLSQSPFQNHIAGGPRQEDQHSAKKDNISGGSGRGMKPSL